MTNSSWKSSQNYQTQFGKCKLGNLEINTHQNYTADYPINEVKADGKWRSEDEEPSCPH